MNDRIDTDRFLRALEYAERKGDHSDPALDDSRDMVKEAIDEGLDMLNYLQWAQSQLKRIEYTEDTDDVEKCRTRAVVHTEKAVELALAVLDYLQEKEGGE